MCIQGCSASSTAAVVGVTPILAAGLVQPAIARTDERARNAPVAKVVNERLDAFAAQAQARLQGSRVEDLSARTEVSQTFAKLDVLWTTEMAAGPERVLGDDGSWRDVDLTLVEGADGSWVPRVAPVGVAGGGGGSQEVACGTFGALGGGAGKALSAAPLGRSVQPRYFTSDPFRPAGGKHTAPVLFHWGSGTRR